MLQRGGWIPPDLADVMRGMVGFRNILVHLYEAVDLDVVRNIVEHQLDDLLRFASLIRSKLT